MGVAWNHDDDEVTLYIASLYNEVYEDYVCHAFTDDKLLFELYIDFHNCKKFLITELKDTFKNFKSFINSNLHNEIYMMEGLVTVHPTKHKKIEVVIPLTEEEKGRFRDALEIYSFTFNMDMYSDIYNLVPYIKDEYREALMDIDFDQIAGKLLNKPGARKDIWKSNNVVLDQVRFFRKVLDECFDS